MHSVTLFGSEELHSIQAGEHQQSPSAVFHSATVGSEEALGGAVTPTDSVLQ